VSQPGAAEKVLEIGLLRHDCSYGLLERLRDGVERLELLNAIGDRLPRDRLHIASIPRRARGEAAKSGAPREGAPRLAARRIPSRRAIKGRRPMAEVLAMR
jgi:hypothetical protein